MANLLLAGFEGLGRAAMGLPKGMAEAEKLRQEEADRALRQRQIGLTEQQMAESRRQFDETRKPLDLSVLEAAGIKLPVGAPSTMDRSTAQYAMPALIKRAEQERQEARQGTALGQAAGLYNLREAMPPGVNPYARPDTSGPLGSLPAMPPAPVSMPERPSQMDIGKALLGAGDVGERIFKAMFPEEKLTVVPPGARAVSRGGRVVAETPPKPGAPHYTEDTQGNVYAITMGPDGQLISRPVPGARGKGRDARTYQTTEEINGRQVRVSYDAAGNVTNRQDIGPAAPKLMPIPAGGEISAVDFSGGVPKVTPLAERAPGPAALKEYRHKDTLEPPPPGTLPSELRKNYRVIPAAQVQTRSVLEGNLLDAERVLREREDLFPRPTGDPVKDAANRKIAQASGWWARQQGDRDMQTLDSLRGMMMQIQRAFGGTSRQMDSIIELLRTERAFHLEPGSERATGEQIRVLRDRLNRGFGTLGLPPMDIGGAEPQIGRPEGAPPAPTVTGSAGTPLRIRDPKTGRTGRLWLQPGEQIPAGLEVIR